MTMKKIFISYSHKDERWKDLLVRHLKVLALEGLCDIWDDREIKVGDDWKPAIENALNQAHIAILMVSADFLGSNFIRTEEVPRLIERRRNQGIWVIPLFVSPCPWKKVLWLAAIQGVPRDNVTLEELIDKGQKGKVEKILADLAEEIAGKIQAVTPMVLPGSNVIRTAPAPGPTSAPAQRQNPFTEVLAIRDGQRFIDRESDLGRLRLLLSGSSVSLQGDNKIGKSSLLWKLAVTWPEPVIGPLSFQLKNWEEIVKEITSKVGKSYKNRTDFRDALLHFHGLLLLDEMELGPGKGLTHNDCSLMRGCLEENRGLKMVIASRKPIMKDSRFVGPDSPLYNICQPHILGPFTETAARQLLAHPWVPNVPGFGATMENELLSLAIYIPQEDPENNNKKEKPGYHPYLLQRAAFHAFEALSDPGYDLHAAFQQDKEQML
jgi:hypothetical protein